MIAMPVSAAPGCCSLIKIALLLSHRIGVPVSSLNDPTMAVADALDQSPLCADIEAPARSDRHSPHMHPLVLPTPHHRPHQIACLEAVPPLLPRHVPPGKAVFVRSAHLPCSMPLRCDQQHIRH